MAKHLMELNVKIHAQRDNHPLGIARRAAFVKLLLGSRGLLEYTSSADQTSLNKAAEEGNGDLISMPAMAVEGP